MNSSLVVRAALLLAVGRLVLLSSAIAEVVVLQSGFDEQNSVPWSYGQLDTGLTYITTGTSNIPFANAFTSADFAAAQAGPIAYTKAPLVQNNFPVYVPSLFAPYPLAQWVNYVPTPLGAQSLLYAMPFQLTTTNITTANLSMKWAVDDFLGDPASSGPNPVGVYLNGQPVPAAITGGSFGFISTASDSNIGPLLQTGQNWIYFYQRDFSGGASGLMFGVTLTIAPEPTTLALAAIALATVLIAYRSRAH
jgi:hypothetical protein